MNWEAMGAIAESLSAIGVIVTVAYLAVQIRQNTKAVRSAAQQAMFDNVQEVRLVFSQDPALAGLVAKANLDYEALTPEDRLRFESLAAVTIGQWENVYFQRDQASVDPAMWSAWDAAYREIVNAPGLRRVFESQKHTYIPGFRDHAETTLPAAAELPARWPALD